MNSKFRYWAPPILWMAFIHFFSTDTFSALHTGSSLEKVLAAIGINLEPETVRIIHFFLRKLAHLVAYAILAWLFLRALRRDRKTAGSFKVATIAFAISALYAIVDEFHQSFTVERTASVADVLLDWSGSLGALLILSARGGETSQERSRSAGRQGKSLS